MEHFIFILMITGISASLSTNITGRFTQVTQTVRECDKEGLMCQDCSTLVYCQKKDFDFIPITVSQCGPDMPCDETKKACTVGGACRYKEFVCPYNLPKPQILPDPYSCRQYWLCNKDVQTPQDCAISSSYNPISTECDLLMKDSPYCLHDPLPPCENNGQKLNIKGTPFNYECVEMLPFNGKYPTIYPYLILDSTDPTGSPKPSNPTNTPKPTKPTDTTIPTNPTDSPTTTDPPFSCPYAGYFPHKTDCTKYYKCVRNAEGILTPTLLKCRIGSYFDEYTKHCVRGKCPHPPRL